MRTVAFVSLGTLIFFMTWGSYGAEVSRGYVGAPAQQLHYRSVNFPSDNVPLIALHLVPNSSQVFLEFMRHVPTSRPVLAFDLPGFGMSDPAPEDTIESYAERILQAIDELELPQFDLLGYHTGAAVAVEIERQASDRVRAVVLTAIPILTQEEKDRFAALPPIAFDEEGEFLKTEWQRSMQWRGPGQTVDSVKRTFAEKMRPGARERGATAVVKYDLETPLTALNKPLLVFRPKDDLWQATSRARVLTPKARWVELPDYGHGLFEVAGPSLAKQIEGFLLESTGE